MNGQRLMRLHVEALFTHDELGWLVRVNELDGAPAPRFFVGMTLDGVVRRFRCDVSDATKRELEDASDDAHLRRHCDDESPDTARYCEILHRVAPIERIWTGPAFSFPRELPDVGRAVRVTEDNVEVLQPLLAAWTPDVHVNPPMFAMVVDGHAVSVCCSVRRTSDAHEAGVETATAYRGRGHAAQVVAAWARAVRAMGAMPLYSTSWTNTASRAVARKLGLTHFGSDLHIT